MKKWTALLLTLALLLGSAAAWAESNPLLYRVTDADGHALYLLGTIHVGGEDMYPISDAVWQAYEAADALAVEMDVTAYSGSLLSALRTAVALMYGLGDNAKKHLSPETYALGVAKLGIPEFVLKRLKPAGWYSLAENYMILSVGLDAALGMDYTLLERAHRDHKRVIELESMDAQMDTLLSLPEDVIDQEIQAMLTYPQEAGQAMRMLYDAWRAGDEETLLLFLELQNEAGEAAPDAGYDEFSQVLIEDRNQGFEEQAAACLKSGETVLIAIGAFHILGEDGLAARLARAGYEVQEIGR